MEQVMSPKDSNENEYKKLMDSIAKMLQENQDTNFDRCFREHFKIFHKYVDAAKKEQTGCFPDTDTYRAFTCAKLFFDKFKYAVFQKKEETQLIENEDHDRPLLEAFLSTKEEIEIKKNRILNGIKKGDILHLRVVEEMEEYYDLQILNKYGDKERIIDCNLSAVLLKSNSVINNIRPSLQIDDLIRATAFENFKPEMEIKKLIVSLNSDNVTDNELKSLHLGRIFKKDIPYCPEDISNLKSYGEYLKASGKFQSPESILKQMCSFGCDPLKTGPLYETRYKKKVPNCNKLSEATEKRSINNKTQKAADLLKKGKLLDAFLEIEEALESYPDNDLALTVRGKIYLALTGGKPSRKVRKAFLDFEAAVKLNCFNKEAADLREAILMESQLSFTEKNLPDKAKQIQDRLKKRSLADSTQEFLQSIKRRKVAPEKARSPVETEASSSFPVTVANLKKRTQELQEGRTEKAKEDRRIKKCLNSQQAHLMLQTYQTL